MLFQALHPVFRGRLSFYDVGTFVCGAVCQQGTYLEFPTVSARIIVLTTFLAFLAIFTSYSANIVALLQSPSHEIRTIQDLVHSPLKLSIQEAGYNRYLYLETNFSLVKKVYESKVKPQGDAGWIYNSFEGIERIRTEMLAFQVETKAAYKAIGRTFTESEKCSLSEIQLVELPMTTILLERNSPYKELYRQRYAIFIISRKMPQSICDPLDCDGYVKLVSSIAHIVDGYQENLHVKEVLVSTASG